MIPDREFVEGANRNQFIQGLISAQADTEQLFVLLDGRCTDPDRVANLAATRSILEKLLFGLQRIALGKARMPDWAVAVIDAAMVEFEQHAKPKAPAGAGKDSGAKPEGATSEQAA